MSLSDWTSVQPGSSVTISLEINTPLVGDGSLKFVNAGTPNGYTNMYLTNLLKGFTKGRIRTLIRADGRPSHVAYERAGIVCLQSGLALNANKNFYTFGWGVGSSTSGTPGTQYWTLGKNVNTTLGSAPTSNLINEAVSVSTGDYYPIQLEWIVDIPNLGGTRLTASVGALNSTDFSTMAVLFDYLDTSSPFTTSVGEGVFDAHPASGFSVAHTYILDETTVYQLV